MGGFPWRISQIKLSQGAFEGNPPVSLVPPVSLLVGFPAFTKTRFVNSAPGNGNKRSQDIPIPIVCPCGSL